MDRTPRRARDPFLEQDGGWGSGATLRHSFDNAQRRERMGCYVLGFQEIGQTQVAVVGGKGAHLGELSRIEGLRVPAGFCVTTDAFQRITAEAPSIDDRLDRLSRLKPGDREAIRALSAEIRRKASVVTQKPAGTRTPSIRESSPRCAPLPPTMATCVRSISRKPNT